MANLIAKRARSYGGRSLQPGDAFEASPKHVRLLVAIGMAEHAPTAGEPASDPEEPTSPTKGRGRYQRRDMRAED